MSDLFDDLQDSSSRDYFYALDSAPGALTPGVGSIRVQGLAPSIFEQSTVFRTPAPATLTINGRALGSVTPLIPGVGALSLAGRTAGLHTTLIVTPAIPAPEYEIEEGLAPTIVFVQTITPQTGALNLVSPALNVSQGGNIATITPQVGQLSLASGEITIVFHPAGLGSLTVQGLEPTLLTERILGLEEDGAIGTGSLVINGLAPTIETPFTWIDVDPPPETTWTTTTGVAA